ncbi:exosome complex component RRP4 [Angomonas deanei]|nr:exosome complex component RRP4 [Angomonas deanei]EPY43306.1 exosome complex component RRP4 [Angomonas deanei]|eukprot:EPY37970.1 exosome complex component RRP4 [Angomonas deanei]
MVDVNAHQHAKMLLSNVTEPGGILRRRDRGDELLMRQLFDQEDLIAAEVQKISSDGVISLHSRGTGKYGKLTQFGQLVKIKASLVKRAKHQFASLPAYKVKLIIGINGYIWVSAYDEGQTEENDDRNAIRVNTARVANCIKLLDLIGEQVSEKSIEIVADTSISLSISPSEILFDQHRETFVTKLKESANLKRPRIE